MWVRRIMVGKNKKEAYFNGNPAAPPHILPAKPYRIPHPRCRLKPSDGIFNALEPRFRQCPMLGAAFAVLPRRRARYNPPRHPPDLETCL
ncbi:hypothetical protein [Neisseria meningitidis]|nr:hypothetical protein [Neisseria meningitidis]MBJ1808911.1 hypothetical protein [Neisseria meningitidis]MCL5941262.1 hypothetical protein [Neisseria meningitidis]